jgi:hypothetical protein
MLIPSAGLFGIVPMSTKDLFEVDLPSDSESDDSDYITDGEQSSGASAEIEVNEGNKRSFKREMQRIKIGKVFERMVQKEDRKILEENHSDVLIDPLILEFQKRQPRAVPEKSLLSVLSEVSKYSNITKEDQTVDVKRYKQAARGSLHETSAAVEKALAGLSNAQIEIEEEVRFAGQVVKLKKQVERTSSHANRFEKRKRALEEEASLGGGSLGSFQNYLNTIKSRRAVTSVEKSATDWNQLKLSTEGMEEAMKIDRGYIDKQAFLVRSDVKEDDIRREARRRRLMESNVEP